VSSGPKGLNSNPAERKRSKGSLGRCSKPRVKARITASSVE